MNLITAAGLRAAFDKDPQGALSAYEADRGAWGFVRVPTPPPRSADDDGDADLPPGPSYVESLQDDRMFNTNECIDALAEVYRCQALVFDLNGSIVRPPVLQERMTMEDALQDDIISTINRAWAREALSRGENYMRRQDFKTAMQCLDQALALDPSLHEARHERALCLGNLKRPLEAIRELDKVVAAEPNNERSAVLRLSLMTRLRPEDAQEYEEEMMRRGTGGGGAAARGGAKTVPAPREREREGAGAREGGGARGRSDAAAGPSAPAAPPSAAPGRSDAVRAADKDLEDELRRAAGLLQRGGLEGSSEGESDSDASGKRKRRRSASEEGQRKRRKKEKRDRKKKDKKGKKEKKEKRDKGDKRDRRRRRESSRSRSSSRSPSRSPHKNPSNPSRSKSVSKGPGLDMEGQGDE